MINEKYTYLIINFLIIIFPIILSFEKKIRYYKKSKNLILTILIISTIFILWDYYFTKIGVWAFNEKYITGIKILNLPLEEILFFISVPYALIFIYEVLKYYQKEYSLKEDIKKKQTKRIIIFFNTIIKIARYFFAFLGILFSNFFLAREYASLIFILTAIFLKKERRIFWIYNFIGIVLFFIFNYILTSMPIVIYYDKILFRVLTIPVEDFFYNFILLSSYYHMYNYISKKMNKKLIQT